MYRGIDITPAWWLMPRSDLMRELSLVEGACANLIRIETPWGCLQPKDQLDYNTEWLGQLQDLCTQCTKRGLSYYFSSSGTAFWDMPAGQKTMIMPKHPKYFANAMVALGQYNPLAIEIWNEPNNPTFNNSPINQYGTLVKLSYQALKQHHPHIQVLAGSVALTDLEYTGSLVSQDIPSYCDAFSVHPYPVTFNPTTWHPPTDPSYTNLVKMHNLVQKPFWITEFGYMPANGPYTVKAIQMAEASKFVDAFCIYSLRSATATPDFGLVNNDFSQTTAFSQISSYWKTKSI